LLIVAIARPCIKKTSKAIKGKEDLSSLKASLFKEQDTKSKDLEKE
jgi:hypothetical protein